MVKLANTLDLKFSADCGLTVRLRPNAPTVLRVPNCLFQPCTNGYTKVTMRVLMLDIAGNPLKWISRHQAIMSYAGDNVISALGDHSVTVYGGVNARSGVRSTMEINSIILTRNRVRPYLFAEDYAPPLTNALLFRRDGYVCLYCGQDFSRRRDKLTRDHVLPLSRGGLDTWRNTVSACRSCNQLKRNRVPEEWGVQLLAVPYQPNYAEYLYLEGRHIIADQQAFLALRFRKDSPIALQSVKRELN